MASECVYIFIYNANPGQNSRQQKTDIFHKCQQTWDRMLSVLQLLTDYRLTESLMRWSQTSVFVCESWVDGDRYREALWNICDTKSVTRWDSLLCLQFVFVCIWDRKNWHIAWAHWIESNCCKHTWTLKFHSFSLTASFTQTSSQKHKRRAASIGKNFLFILLKCFLRADTWL